MRRYLFRRSPEYTAHDLEERIRTALVVTGPTLLTHDAKTLLGYVRGQIEAIEAVVAFAGGADHTDVWRDTAVHGFLTGSADLLLLLREHVGFRLPSRVKLTRGLSHKFSDRDKSPDQELFAALNSYESAGVRKLVLVDEVVGGGSACAQLKRFKKWRGRNSQRAWQVLYVGLTEKSGDNHDDLRCTVAKNYPWADLRLIHVPELPAMDEKGEPISSIMSLGFRYYPYRYWGGGYQVRCANTLTTCSQRLVAAGSTAEAYRSTIRAIVRAGPHRGNIWPDVRCDTCASAIEDIRARFARLPQPSQGVVVARVIDRNKHISLLRPVR